jgi:hypothetical protein
MCMVYVASVDSSFDQHNYPKNLWQMNFAF